jgi:electron transfer flavoprotein beta subunit
MQVLVCVKRVPVTGGRITLTPDEQEIDTRYLGFTVSPHEECAVEEAVRLIERHGGASVVMTLGPPEAEEQLRDAMALGADRAILLQTDGADWDPMATARAITRTIRDQESVNGAFDLVLFGNESADSGGHQVGVRVAHALGRPCVTGVKAIELGGAGAVVRREAAGGWEVFEVPLPAVLGVKEGLNLPRYPSMPGRLKAKKRPVERIAPEPEPGGQRKVRLMHPPERENAVEVLGSGPEAAPRVVEVLRKAGVL